MEDGEESFEIPEGDVNPEEENEISRNDPEVFSAVSNTKVTPNSILPIGDANGSPGSDLELEEDGDNQRFDLPVQQVKKISGMLAEEAPSNDLENVRHESEGDKAEAEGYEDGVENDSSAQAEGLQAWHQTYEELSKPGAAENLMPAELTMDNTQSLMCLSDIASTRRPNIVPGEDSSEPDRMEVDVNESGEEVSHGALNESGSAFDPPSPSEVRTEVSSILHKEEFCEVYNSVRFSESRPLEVGETEDLGVDNVEKTMCKGICRVDQNETFDECKWNELEERLCPNGESISSDSNQHDCNLSGSSSSPVNRLSDLEKESLKNLNSKQICDSEQTFVYDDKGVDNGMCVESETQNSSSEPGSEEIRCDNVQSEIPSGVCDKAPQDESISTQVLSDNKSSAHSVKENQCNGDIDFREDSNHDNVEWCDAVNMSEETEGRPEVEDSSAGLEGKRKQTFDDVEAGESSLPCSAECRSSTKMFKVDHNVAEINQESTVDRSTANASSVSQPLDGRALFPGNIQANSQISDYAQYLGLQPTVKFKCVRCGERSFSSMMDLKTHQYACLKSHTPSQPNPSPAPFAPQTSSTNFRITRKVYLCSVCGTYYENWNLFLHMREVHKRHICLFCLGMFSQAERLSAHLVAKHNIVEGHYGNAEEFRLSCKGSVFLMCCSCEKVFSEEDSYSNHPCKDRSSAVKPSSSSSLVPAKNQSGNSSNKAASTPFVEKKQTSKQSVDAVGRAAKSAETKAGKGGSSASARPKQILKVKIPIQPKKSETPPVKTPKVKAAVASLPPPPQQRSSANFEKNGFDTMELRLTDAHLDAVSSQSTDPNLMSNLDRTINAVALGITGEALEWQQRKNEEFEEPAPLPCLDLSAKSDSDTNSLNLPNFESEGNIDEVPLETPAEPIPEIGAEQPEPSPPSVDIPEIESLRSEPESREELPAVGDVAVEQEPEPEPEVEAESQVEPELPAPSPPPAEESVLDKASSPAEPGPALPERTPEESDIDSDDSDKLSLVVDETASGAENEEKNTSEETSAPQESVATELTDQVDEPPAEEPVENVSPEKVLDIPMAGDDVPITDVTIEEPLEDIPIQALLKECVKALCYVCVYCSHARRIAVNGKQLALHTLAEHRFSPIDGSDCQDPPPTVRFTSRLKDSIQNLQDLFFNTDTYDSTDKSSCLPYDRTYECFHCHFFTRSHKELYIHNRKMHQKTILLCIMCKSNFYSYSELLCHLCPGIYIPQCNVGFHCCMCDVDNLPSAFRLMVHLRKKHHACDVCLEVTGDQQKLSSHVWKHKLHHLCYRCGIAYRNKPDITNHLFWKHGTESVLCKKCLQKKWPHVYHFCVPPATFTCEECNSLFTRAVSLRVHKRIHTGEQPHPCSECQEKFISKKLLAKHTLIHTTPVPEEKPEPMDVTTDDPSKDGTENDLQNEGAKEEASDAEKERESDKDKKSKKKKHKEKEEQKKKVVDVYDLPPLNLSSESDSSDDEAKKEAPNQSAPTVSEPVPPVPPVPEPVEEPQPTQVLGIWDNFTNFQKNLEKRENADATAKNPTPEPQEDPNDALLKIVLMDHDYCAPIDPNNPPPEPTPAAEPEVKEKEEEKSEIPAPEEAEKPEPVNVVEENPAVTPPHSKDDSKSLLSPKSLTKKKRSPKKRTRRKSSSSSSGSSSGSDSSSCSCGTNCSCSSSSSSDSSSSSSDSDSSSSEGRRRAQVRRELRKERALEKKKEEEAASAAAPPEEPHIDVMEAEPAFRESDLDTTETDTDEDFYDERPQKPPDESQVEKRNLMLLASVAPLNNGSTSPTPLLLDVQASLQQQYPVPELNPAAVTGGKKRTKKRKKKQTHYHSKLTLPPPLSHEVTPPVLNVADSLQGAPDRFPPMYYAQSAPSPIPPLVQRHPLTPSFQQSTPELNNKKPLITKLTREVVPNPGSGSETEGRTKRKRMPNKFYGYSSDEETEDHNSTQKWRKTEVTITHTPPPPPPPPVVPPVQRIPVSPLTLKRTVPSVPAAPPPITLQLTKSMLTAKTDSDSEESKRVTSSSSSADSDDDAMQISEAPQHPHPHANTTLSGDAPVRESNDNLYCYCQCPYDEVSEMIACDGKNCAIEWFHFECVGIMVPPKGQWYCPDCRKHMTGYQGIE